MAKTKDELKADYKELTGKDIDGTNAEIEDAIEKATPKETANSNDLKGNYVATQPFTDKFTKKNYKVGDKVETPNQSALDDRLHKKLIKKA